MPSPLWTAVVLIGAIATASCQPEADPHLDPHPDPDPAPRVRSEARDVPVAVRIDIDPATDQHSLDVDASAYNSVPAQTDSLPNEGAWGDAIEPGMRVIAVSPDLLEAGLDRGTVVFIEGLEGPWTVLDRTASRLQNRIDIYMGEDVDAAVE